MPTRNQLLKKAETVYVWLIWNIPDWLLSLFVGFIGGMATNILTGGNYSEHGEHSMSYFVVTVITGFILVAIRVKIGKQYDSRSSVDAAERRRLAVAAAHIPRTIAVLIIYPTFLICLYLGFREEFRNNTTMRKDMATVERMSKQLLKTEAKKECAEASVKMLQKQKDSLLFLLGAKAGNRPKRGGN
jgi:hypothetical protein